MAVPIRNSNVCASSRRVPPSPHDDVLDAMHIEVKSEVGGNQRLASNTSSCGEGGTLDGMDGTGVEPKKFWGKDHRFNTSSRRLLPV